MTEFVEPEKNLLVFGGKLPADDLTRTIDTVLVQHGAQPEVTTAAEWQAHQRDALERLRASTFRNIPADHAPRGRNVRQDGSTKNGEFFITREFASCDGLNLRVKIMRAPVRRSLCRRWRTPFSLRRKAVFRWRLFASGHRRTTDDRRRRGSQYGFHFGRSGVPVDVTADLPALGADAA